ncbi:MAG: MBL fold metallo-hydrolase [Chloroflexi bacterium]|nr:MBL fold metallo-hydrolase [Chloroflexota bacterium]
MEFEYREAASFRVGALEVVQLSDGSFGRDARNFFDGVDAGAWTSACGISAPEEPVPWAYSGYLVRGDGHTTLIDTALGERPCEPGILSCAEFPQRLAECGVEPADVDVLLHSHLHWDHVGWDVTRDGAVAYPGAEVRLSGAELDFWMTPHPQAPERHVLFANEHFRPLLDAGQVRTFDGDAEVTPSITMIATPGHTPGHTVQLIRSEGEALILVGDAMHHWTHVEHHDWLSIHEWDPEQSRDARRRICELAIETDALVTGPHFPLLTVGKVRRDGSGYRYEQVRLPSAVVR